MSGISSATDVGTMGTVLYNTTQTRRLLDTLTEQGSSGLISADFAGLGGGARTALDVGGQISLNKQAISNAAQAATVNQITQTALGQIQSLVAGLSNQLLGPAVGTAVGLSSLATSARAALGQVASLLNTQVGQVYVFGGKDSRNPPVPDAGNMTQSALYVAVQAAIANLPVAGAAATQMQLLGLAAPGATSPFSASLELSNQLSSADLGGGQSVQLGVLADQNTDAVSAGVGATSTGSYMRDVMMALSALGAMGSADATNPQVQGMLGNVQTTLRGADNALNTDIGGLGSRQETISNAQTELTATATALTTQLGAVEDADTAAVATQLAAAQNQLQASYKIIASLEQLSLAKFL